MEPIDTHYHLDVVEPASEHEAVIAAAGAAGASTFVVPTIHRAGGDALLGPCAAGPGLHPVHWAQHQDEDIPAPSRRLLVAASARELFGPPTPEHRA